MDGLALDRVDFQVLELEEGRVELLGVEGDGGVLKAGVDLVEVDRIQGTTEDGLEGSDRVDEVARGVREVLLHLEPLEGDGLEIVRDGRACPARPWLDSLGWTTRMLAVLHDDAGAP
ncbi:MAG: hypothetical protein R3B70_30330 [Polyangiaceae bacterium]